MTYAALLLFLFPLAYSPGPGNLFFAVCGARFGLRATLSANAGYHLATVLVTAAIGFGFAQVHDAAPMVLGWIKALGVAYVLWLAWKLAGAKALSGEHEAASVRGIDGVMLLILNPKAYVIIALMFSQFPATTATDVLAIALVFTLNNFVAFLAWTTLGDQLGRLFRTPGSARWLNRGLGAALAGVAFWMALP